MDVPTKTEKPRNQCGSSPSSTSLAKFECPACQSEVRELRHHGLSVLTELPRVPTKGLSPQTDFRHRYHFWQTSLHIGVEALKPTLGVIGVFFKCCNTLKLISPSLQAQRLAGQEDVLGFQIPMNLQDRPRNPKSKAWQSEKTGSQTEPM